MGFPCSSAGKESACSAGDLSPIPGLERSPGEGKGYPQETWVRFLGWEDPLEKGKATHSSILAWRIPWTLYSPLFIFSIKKYSYHFACDRSEIISFGFYLDAFNPLTMGTNNCLLEMHSCVTQNSSTGFQTAHCSTDVDSKIASF